MISNGQNAPRVITTTTAKHVYNIAKTQLFIQDNANQFKTVFFPLFHLSITRPSESGSLRLFTNLHCVLQLFTLNVIDGGVLKFFVKSLFSTKSFEFAVVVTSKLVRKDKVIAYTGQSRRQCLKRLWRGNRYIINRSSHKNDP